MCLLDLSLLTEVGYFVLTDSGTQIQEHFSVSPEVVYWQYSNNNSIYQKFCVRYFFEEESKISCFNEPEDLLFNFKACTVWMPG